MGPPGSLNDEPGLCVGRVAGTDQVRSFFNGVRISPLLGRESMALGLARTESLFTLGWIGVEGPGGGIDSRFCYSLGELPMKTRARIMTGPGVVCEMPRRKVII